MIGSTPLAGAALANPGAPDYGQCSDRFSVLAQECLFLALVRRALDQMAARDLKP